MPLHPKALSPAAEQLNAIVEDGGELAKAVRAALDRSQLSLFRRGLSAPSVQTAATLEELTGGRVAANGWKSPDARARPKKRRCGSCGKRGHDRRACPSAVATSSEAA